MKDYINLYFSTSKQTHSLNIIYSIFQSLVFVKRPYFNFTQMNFARLNHFLVLPFQLLLLCLINSKLQIGGKDSTLERNQNYLLELYSILLLALYFLNQQNCISQKIQKHLPFYSLLLQQVMEKKRIQSFSQYHRMIDFNYFNHFQPATIVVTVTIDFTLKNSIKLQA